MKTLKIFAFGGLSLLLAYIIPIVLFGIHSKYCHATHLYEYSFVRFLAALIFLFINAIILEKLKLFSSGYVVFIFISSAFFLAVEIFIHAMYGFHICPILHQ